MQKNKCRWPWKEFLGEKGPGGGAPAGRRGGGRSCGGGPGPRPPARPGPGPPTGAPPGGGGEEITCSEGKWGSVTGRGGATSTPNHSREEGWTRLRVGVYVLGLVIHDGPLRRC